MSKGLAGVAVIALIVAFAAYAWLERLPQTPTSPTDAPVANAPSPAAASLPRDAAERTAVTGARDAGHDLDPSTARERSIVVRALLDDGRPAAGARVDVGTLQPRKARWSSQPGPDHEEPQVQASFTTDANGEARVPWRHAALGNVLVAVRHGVAVGHASISASAAPGSNHDVRLAVEQSLRVCVVDANDGPLAGVPIGARGTVRGEDGSDDPGGQLAPGYPPAPTAP